MVCMFWENTAFLNDTHPLNALEAILMVAFGKLTNRSTVHPEKALDPIDVIPFGITMFSSIEHPLNVLFCIVFNPVESVTFLRDRQFVKTAAPSDFTLFGSTKDFKA